MLPAALILSITPVVLIDPNYTSNHPGTLGVKSIYEVAYNDNLVAILAKLLVDDGLTVMLTRQPSQEMSLEKRAEIVNSNQAHLFLSIHHDSAQRYIWSKLDSTISQYTKPSNLLPDFLFSFQRKIRNLKNPVNLPNCWTKNY